MSRNMAFSTLQFILVWGICFAFPTNDAFVLPLSRPSFKNNFVSSRHVSPSRLTSPLRASSSNEQQDQAMEALRSLVDFHEGSWKGSATSFTVTQDVAAGIVQRHSSPDYQTAVRLQLSDKKYSMAETFMWQDKVVSRSCSLAQSNADVDSVDSSYSLDSALLDLPSDISGTDKLVQFGIEHCLATSDDERVRCFVLYGVDKSLARIVICNESRIKTEEKVSPQELLSLNSDIDRIVDKIANQIEGNTDADAASSTSLEKPVESNEQERLEQLQRVLSSSDSSTSTSSEEEGSSALSQRTMTLMDMTSGVWLGDTIIRDMANVGSSSTPSAGKGFGSANADSSQTPAPSQTSAQSTFGDWTVGVQKVAWRWVWDYGERVSQIYDFGRGMGAETCPELPRALSGDLCVNESFSRRIPKEERMIYIDFDNGDYVSFVMGSVEMQVPRFLTFSSASKQAKPFFTEFSVFQSDRGAKPIDSDAKQEAEETEVCCSKITRLYNSDGQLKQGCTSFFTLKDMSKEDA